MVKSAVLLASLASAKTEQWPVATVGAPLTAPVAGTVPAVGFGTAYNGALGYPTAGSTVTAPNAAHPSNNHPLQVFVVFVCI